MGALALLMQVSAALPIPTHRPSPAYRLLVSGPPATCRCLQERRPCFES